MTMNIYVANLGKYNEGILKGEWLTLPVSEEELNQFLTEKVGINAEYEEWAIHDYECDYIKISEYENIFKLNEIAEKVENLADYEKETFKALIECETSDVEEALEILENGNFIVYNDIDTVYDLGYAVAEETGILSQIPENLQSYFDFEKFGRDLTFEGYCIASNNIAIQTF